MPIPEGETDEKLNEITEMLKETVVGNCTITLAGSHAKGMADDESDIDIYMYLDTPKSLDERVNIVQKIADNQICSCSPDYQSTCWGGLITFNYKGTLIEVTCRLYENGQKIIDDCFEGRIEVYPEIWTINGFYSYSYFAEMSYVIPLWDPIGFVENNRKKTIVYPSKLKKAIIDRFLPMVGLLKNPSYISAVTVRIYL